MSLDPATLPTDVAALTALLLAANARAEKADARTLDLDAQIANLATATWRACGLDEYSKARMICSRSAA